VTNLHERAKLRARGLTFGDESALGPWQSAAHARATTRGLGEPIPAWTNDGGELIHHPGHADDLLYLSVPLRGDFQLDCELSASGGRDIRAAYAALAMAPSGDLRQLVRSHFGRALPETPINAPLEKLGDWYGYRLVVNNGVMTASINGQQVLWMPVPADRDPWFALFSSVSWHGGARNVRISGNPTIPERLDLSALSDLTGWLAEEYGNSINWNNADWEKQGDEIVGRTKVEFPGSKLESVLRYHRPMMEDGEVTYEFFYEPGKVVVHPALDRLAFLLEPEGVKLHRLTDAQYERSGLDADNVIVEPECRRGPASLPLKANGWNRVVLNVTGDRLSLRLNGELVYERPIEATNQRSFGLFHFADETMVRVRGLIYEGQWPKTLPASLVAPENGKKKPSR
jgi:hypothetical protein